MFETFLLLSEKKIVVTLVNLCKRCGVKMRSEMHDFLSVDPIHELIHIIKVVEQWSWDQILRFMR